MPPAIETQGLRKTYGGRVAVADLSLRVETGEVFGFLGPNGAGKTTSIKMLLGLVAPTAGGGRILGAPPGDHRTRARIGFLPEHFRFHDWLSADEFLRLHADLYGMARSTARRRIPALLERVGLAAQAQKKLQQYSKGMLQRVGLAQALINDPALVILDEPTSGLDPGGRRTVRDLIRDELRARGTTVFLNSHLLGEVEVTCDRVAFIKAGEVVWSGALAGLAGGELRVRVRAGNLKPETVAGLARFASAVRADGAALEVTVPGEAAVPAIHRYLVEQGAEVYAFEPHRVSLEDLFLRIVGPDGGL